LPGLLERPALAEARYWHYNCQLFGRRGPRVARRRTGGETAMPAYEEFGGRIGRTHAESEPWWPTPPHPGEEAPNVAVILLDALGFAQLGCYGSDIETPNIDRLAAGGLRYSNFHVSPICSPTRAALLTGRHSHAVGMRAVANFNSGYPHMRGAIT